jgi:endonuclease YncB( thermonuclease family)
MRRFARRFSVVLLLSGLFALWLLSDGRGEMRSASGDVITVRDGDTIRFGGLDYRLHGIDAPEYRQVCKDGSGADWPCGNAARAGLVDLIRGKILTCEERARDKYDRVVATCRDEAGRDLALSMVQLGLAISLDGLSEGPYATPVEIARAKKLGIWQGAFDSPATWREKNGHPPR